MTETNVAERVLDALAFISGSDEVRTNAGLRLFEREVMDSMKTVELIVALEEQFGLHVSPAELDREMWATPEKIIADVQRRLAR
jgi:D-alanine--poly(phosphoribitol) ligase subunit 2